MQTTGRYDQSHLSPQPPSCLPRDPPERGIPSSAQRMVPSSHITLTYRDTCVSTIPANSICEYYGDVCHSSPHSLSLQHAPVSIYWMPLHESPGLRVGPRDSQAHAVRLSILFQSFASLTSITVLGKTFGCPDGEFVTTDSGSRLGVVARAVARTDDAAPSGPSSDDSADRFRLWILHSSRRHHRSAT
jgi:hypothetical protein